MSAFEDAMNMMSCNSFNVGDSYNRFVAELKSIESYTESYESAVNLIATALSSVSQNEVKFKQFMPLLRNRPKLAESLFRLCSNEEFDFRYLVDWIYRIENEEHFVTTTHFIEASHFFINECLERGITKDLCFLPMRIMSLTYDYRVWLWLIDQPIEKAIWEKFKTKPIESGHSYDTMEFMICSEELSDLRISKEDLREIYERYSEKLLNYRVDHTYRYL